MLRVTSRSLGASLMLLMLAQVMVRPAPFLHPSITPYPLPILTIPHAHYAHPPHPTQGIYLLSTLIQLRTSFPPPPERPDTEPDPSAINLFSTLPEYQFFGALFDGAFLLAAGVSAAVRWFGDRVTG